MSKGPSAAPVSDRRIALLVDADNVTQARIGAIVAHLPQHGVANIRRAYGDWTSASLKGWKDKLHLHAIRPMQQFSYSTGKNATDMALVIDAMELLYTQQLDGFCVVSSDADFTPLVMQLRANGRDVHGLGERKTPEPFVNACTTFAYLDTLEGGGVDADPEPAQSPSQPDAPAEPKPAEGVRNLAGDTRLVTALRAGVDASAGADGWASMASAGNAVKCGAAAIDPRDYGVKGFTALFAQTNLFDIVKVESGESYVADKRNKGRAPRPGMQAAG